MYRFGREPVKYIVNLVADEKNTTNDRNHAVSTIIQVLFITLIFLASGSFLQVIRDTGSFLGFDESTVSRVVRRVTQALTTKLGDFERFPSTRAERDDIKENLFRFSGFPCASIFIYDLFYLFLNSLFLLLLVVYSFI